MPTRVQRKRTKGWRMPPGTIYVGRPTVWGNPFGSDGGNIGDAVVAFREYVMSGLENRPSTTGHFAAAADATQGYPRRKRIIDSLPQLRGKNLACWCKPGAPCHADVLLEIANRPEPR